MINFSIKQLNRAKEIALASYDPNFAEHRCQHISVINYGNRVISIAKNSKKTSPINLINKKIAFDGSDISGITGTCSEWNAARKVKNMTNYPFEKCVLFSMRLNRNKEFCNSLLCKSCQSLSKFLNFSRVFYTQDNGSWAEFNY